MNTDKLMELERKWPLDRHPDPHTDAWTLGYLRAKRECADELAAALRAEQAVGEVPEAKQVSANAIGGVIAAGEWVINFGTHIRVTNAEFARGWNECRALGTARQSEEVIWTGKVDLICASDAVVIDGIENPAALLKQRVEIRLAAAPGGEGEGS